MRSQLVGLRVPFCWQIAPSGGGQTAWAPSTQVGVPVHWGADVVVVAAGRQIEGVTVTVTVDAEQVFVAVGGVPHVLGVDFTEVPGLVVVGDDLTGVLCEVALPGDVDDAVDLGTLTVVLRYISPTTRHSFSVNVALPMVPPQCRC